MNKFKTIPQSFTIASQLINVNHTRFVKDGSKLGTACLYMSEILLAEECTTDKVSDGSKLNTFYHELTHIILDQYGYYEMSEYERFVEQFASLLTYWYNNDKLKLIFKQDVLIQRDYFETIKSCVNSIVDFIGYNKDDKNNLINFISLGIKEFEESAIYKD